MRYLVFAVLFAACQSPKDNVNGQIKAVQDSLDRSIETHRSMNNLREIASENQDFKTANNIYFQLDSINKEEKRLRKKIDSLTFLVK